MSGLLGAGRAAIDPGGDGCWLPGIGAGERGGRRALLEAAAQLYVRGLDLDWVGMDDVRQRRRLALPTYPFQRERYWVDVEIPEPGAVDASDRLSTIPGRRLRSPRLRESVFESTLSARRPAVLGEHRVFGGAVVPAAWFLVSALEAAERCLGPGPHSLEQVVIGEALRLDDGAGRTVQVVIDTAAADRSFEILSRARDADDDDWSLHVAGGVGSPPTDPGAGRPADLDAIRARCADEVDPETFYRQLAGHGFDFGSAFRRVTSTHRRDGEALGRIELSGDFASPDGDDALGGMLALDSCIQLLGMALPTADRDALYMPLGFAEVRRHAKLEGVLYSHAVLGSPAPDGDATAELKIFDEGGSLRAELIGVRVRKLSAASWERSRASAAGQRWLYELEWRDAPAAGGGERTLDDERWLVLADRGGIGRALATELERAGARVDLVEAAGEASPEETASASGRAVTAAIEAAGANGLRGVVSLGALDSQADDSATTDALESEALAATSTALRAAQALLQSAPGAPGRLWLVTRGCCPAGEPPSGSRAPAQATLWGLGRAIEAEHPELGCTRIDLDPSRVDDEAQALAAELLRPGSESEVALRRGRRRISRMVRRAVPATSAAPSPWQAEGTYLITGGLGGIGLRLARWAVDEGARRLVLASRGAARPEAIGAVEEMRAAGAEVRIARVDVGDAAQVEQLIASIEDGGTSLRGLFHCAGVYDDRALLRQDEESLRRSMRAKLRGAWNLDRATRGLDLDSFVLFSSAASVIGSPGQANYCAANAFLDALAHDRRRRGLAALSVNWGPWAGVGEADSRGLAQNFADRGLASIDAPTGMRLLDLLLATETTQVTVLPVDWPRFASRFRPGTEPARLGELLGAARASKPAHDAGDGGELLRLWLETPTSNRERMLRSRIRQLAAGVLGIAKDGTIDPETPLSELGLDSLMAVELRNELGRSLGRGLSATLLFDHPTIGALTEHLAAELGSTVAPPAPRAAPAKASPEAKDERLSELSDDALASMLADKLASIADEEDLDG